MGGVPFEAELFRVNEDLSMAVIIPAIEGNKEVIEDYVDFLVKNGIVTFSSNVLNGFRFY